jgi:hypothetical protein
VNAARSIRTVALALALGLLVPAACTDAGVVGGECRAGFSSCDGQCVDPGSDPKNCGVCGNVCLAGVLCVVGVCGGDGGVDPDASTDGAGDAPSDVQHPDRDGPETDGGGDGSSGDGSSGDGGDACTPPFNTPQQCGDCFTACPSSAPICALVDGGYACVPFCEPPLVQCGSECVDTNSDPDHCGQCFNKCPSGICQGGQCVGATTGHVVLACMNYEQSFQNTPQTTLLGNAVFLPPASKDPVRVLAFDQFSQQAVENKVDQTVGWAATAKGRTFTITDTASGAQVISDLNILNYEVFLIYEQSNAPAGTLAQLGNSWFTTLDPFVKAGGIVIVLDAGQGVAEMGELTTNAGLMPITGHTSVTLQTVHNSAPADAIGVNVISPFLAQPDTCTFTTSATPGPKTTFVITDSDVFGAGAPVVVHRVP